MMLHDAEDIASIYEALGERVVPPVGPVFDGIFRAADIDPLSPSSISGDYELRYAAGSASLEPGDVVSIRQTAYRVSDDPYRINDGLELTVRLREVA